MISKKQVKNTIAKKNELLKKDGMKIGVHEKDINKGHIGLGRYITDNSRLFVQLAMKTIGLSEDLLPKGFLEENNAEEKGDDPSWEWGNFAGIVISLVTVRFSEASVPKSKKLPKIGLFDCNG